MRETPPEPLFPPLKAAVRSGIERLLTVIDETFPLKRRFSAELPKNIARLSALLTKERSELNGLYMSSPALFNAYLRWFLPWNVFRLSRLLPSLSLETRLGATPEIPYIIDLGSGPLTLPVSLWIALPELRGAPLRFLCVDQNRQALEAGVKLFFALAPENRLWQIKTRRAGLGGRLAFGPAALVTAVNVCNELFQHLPEADTETLSLSAKKFSRTLAGLAGNGGRILVVEPGAPRPAQFLNYMRSGFIERSLAIESPCPAPNMENCAMRGGRRGQKWCHFNIDAGDAPAALHKLSAEADLPKEKVTLSFLLASKTRQPESTAAGVLNARVISDTFALPENRSGRYACCEKGLALLSGNRALLENYGAGVFFKTPAPPAPRRDAKSGALILNLGDSRPAR